MAQESNAIPQVGPPDPSKKNSPIAEGSPPEGQAAGPAAPSSSVCYWNGQAHSEGATVCSSGMKYRCTSGV